MRKRQCSPEIASAAICSLPSDKNVKKMRLLWRYLVFNSNHIFGSLLSKKITKISGYNWLLDENFDGHSNFMFNTFFVVNTVQGAGVKGCLVPWALSWCCTFLGVSSFASSFLLLQGNAPILHLLVWFNNMNKSFQCCCAAFGSLSGLEVHFWACFVGVFHFFLLLLPIISPWYNQGAAQGRMLQRWGSFLRKDQEKIKNLSCVCVVVAVTELEQKRLRPSTGLAPGSDTVLSKKNV